MEFLAEEREIFVLKCDRLGIFDILLKHLYMRQEFATQSAMVEDSNRLKVRTQFTAS